MAENDFNKPTRRVLQFSLRGLFVFTLVLCIALGWKVERARSQRDAVAWVQRQLSSDVISSVTYDYELDDRSVRIPNAKPPGPDWLVDLLGVDFFAKVTRVWLTTDATDLTPLEGLRDIQYLQLKASQATDL